MKSSRSVLNRVCPRVLWTLCAVAFLFLAGALMSGAEDAALPESVGLEFHSLGDGTCYVEALGTCEDSHLVIPRLSPEGERVEGVSFFWLFATARHRITGMTFHENIRYIWPGLDYGINHTLTSISVHEDNPYFSCVDNCVVETATGTLVLACPDSPIPADGRVTKIGSRVYTAFGLTEIHIPEGITEIGYDSFSFNRFTEVSIPEGVTSIDMYAFDSCRLLREVVLPSTLKSLDPSAFSACMALETVYFRGTPEEWAALGIEFWYFGPNTEVICLGSSVEIYVPEGELWVSPNGVPAEGIVHCSDGHIRFCKAGAPQYAGLVADAQGKLYYFNSSRVAVKECYYVPSKHNGLLPASSYYFDENGVLKLDTTKNGIITDGDGQVRFYRDGIPQYAGLVQDGEGNYYYISSSTFTAVKNCSYTISKTNGLLAYGTYVFGADGKMQGLNGLVADADGNHRYYVNGDAQYMGLICVDGDFYYINSSKLAVKKRFHHVSKTNGLLEAGVYYFGADGKLMKDVQKNGLSVDEDGEIRYYENGAAVYAGLIRVDGYYYYINSSCRAVRDRTYTIGAPMLNDLLPGGTYVFDAQGRIVFDE